MAGMRPRRGFSNKPTRGSTKYANKIANRKSVSVSRAAYRKANAKAKMSVVHRIRTVFGSQTLLSMVHLRPFTHGKERRTGFREVSNSNLAFPRGLHSRRYLRNRVCK